MSRLLNDLEKTIIQALKRRSLTTREIAEEIREEPGKVYNLCKRLEKREGVLTSKIEKRGRRAFYFPTTKEILNSDNYETIMNQIEKADDPEIHLYCFTPKTCVWSLPGDPIIWPPIKK